MTEHNAHPLAGCDDGKLAIVLNGIVENYRELKASLEADGHTFTSQTDAEVVVHLIERHYDGDLLEATREAYTELEGHFAFVVIHHDHPEELVGARLPVPAARRRRRGRDVPRLDGGRLPRRDALVQLIEDGEVVSITPEGARFVCVEDGELEEREVIEVDWDDEAAEKGGYETFMLKEIYEQPEAVARDDRRPRPPRRARAREPRPDRRASCATCAAS